MKSRSHIETKTNIIIITADHYGEKLKDNNYYNYSDALESDTISFTEESEEKSNNYELPQKDLVNSTIILFNIIKYKYHF